LATTAIRAIVVSVNGTRSTVAMKLPDIDRADAAVLTRMLTALESEYRVTSAEVARGVTPPGIACAELEWWRSAVEEVAERTTRTRR
jgi:hypothetical protein